MFVGKVNELKNIIKAFDTYYDPSWPSEYVGANYVEVAKLCRDLMLDDADLEYVRETFNCL